MSSAAPARSSEPQARALRYERHRPGQTLLYRIVAQHYPAFVEHMAGRGRSLPDYVQAEFESYLKCGCLEHGFLRVRCDTCHAEHLVAFSCKRRGVCPSCGARRMAETAALLVDQVLPEKPLRFAYRVRRAHKDDPARASVRIAGSLQRRRRSLRCVRCGVCGAAPDATRMRDLCRASLAAQTAFRLSLGRRRYATVTLHGFRRNRRSQFSAHTRPKRNPYIRRRRPWANRLW